MSEKAFSAGNKLAKLTKSQKKIIGHTWLTHVRKKDSSEQIGEVVWHTLNENGKTEYYDVQWPDGILEKNIHIRYLIVEKVQEHEHESIESRKENLDESGILRLSKKSLKDLLENLLRNDNEKKN